jgi:hypothetical protein
MATASDQNASASVVDEAMDAEEAGVSWRPDSFPLGKCNQYTEFKTLVVERVDYKDAKMVGFECPGRIVHFQLPTSQKLKSELKSRSSI